MSRDQIGDKVRRVASAKMNKYMAQGRDGGDVACPNWPEDHMAKLILLKDGKEVTICPECGYEHIG